MVAPTHQTAPAPLTPAQGTPGHVPEDLLSTVHHTRHGYGYGDGDGYGNGNGDGYGYGNGDGYGYGDGYGDGDGYGF